MLQVGRFSRAAIGLLAFVAAVAAVSFAWSPPGRAEGLSHPLSKPELQRALLTIKDLPAGYSRTTASSSKSDAVGSCANAKDPLEGATRAQAEADFGRGTFGPFIFEVIAQQRPGTAAKGMTAFRKLLARCSSFNSRGADGTSTTGHFTPESFPRLGDDTIALRLRLQTHGGDSLNVSLAGDVVVVRTGDVVTLVMQAGFVQAPPTSPFVRVVRRAFAKVEQARR
jgi:hypothetical protein